MGALQQALATIQNPSSSFVDPSDEPSAKFWIKADALGLSDNDPISSVTDLIGGVVYSAAGSARPTFKDGILNSKAVMRFATDDVLTPATTGYTYTTDNTIIVICTERTSGSGYIFSGDGAGGEGGPAFITGFASKDFEYFTRGTGERQTFAASAAAGFHMLALRRPDGGAFGETYQWYFDNSFIGSATVVGTDNLNGKHLTKIGDFTAGDFYNGDLAEMIICDSILNDTQLNNFAGYFNSEYALSLPML